VVVGMSILSVGVDIGVRLKSFALALILAHPYPHPHSHPLKCKVECQEAKLVPDEVFFNITCSQKKLTATFLE
jgi:hypothetical protein